MSPWLMAAAWSVVVRAAPSGSLTLQDASLTVRRKSTFEAIYTVGPDGFDPGDSLILRDPIFHGMRWSKWGDLSPDPSICTPIQDSERASVGYLTAHAERDGERLDGVDLSVERDNCKSNGTTTQCSTRLHLDTWTHVSIASGDGLQEGDEIVLVVGDEEGCRAACEAAAEGDCAYCDDCGFQSPSRAFPVILWTAQECLADDGTCEDLDPPALQVNAREEVATVLVTVPSLAVVDQPFRVKVALLDELGNPVETARDGLVLDLQGAPATGDLQAYTLGETDSGWHDFTVIVHEPGAWRFRVDSSGGQSGLSNPVLVSADPPDYFVYWGDIHVHHGLSWTDDDGVSHDLNHGYARDVVGLQVTCEAVKAEGIEIDDGPLWEEMKQNCTAYTQPGSYLVLLGFEWMGSVAGQFYGERMLGDGHHNVYYDSCDAPFGTHDPETIPGLADEGGLWDWLDEVYADYGVRAVTIPHAPQNTGYNFDVSYPGVQTLLEIYSEWGRTDRNTDTGTEPPGGSTEEMIDKGLVLGWIGASDNHDGWMGNQFTKNFAASGIGAYLAPALTRAEVFGAMQRRRTYATTGHRPVLLFEADLAGEVHQQGEALAGGHPLLRWTVYGTDTVTDLRLYQMVVGSGAQEVVYETAPGRWDVGLGSWFPDWDGLEATAWWLRVEQGDGELAWSSPIWAVPTPDEAPERQLEPPELSWARRPEACGGAGGLALGVVLLGLRRRRPEA